MEVIATTDRNAFGLRSVKNIAHYRTMILLIKLCFCFNRTFLNKTIIAHIAYKRQLTTFQ